MNAKISQKGQYLTNISTWHWHSGKPQPSFGTIPIYQVSQYPTNATIHNQWIPKYHGKGNIWQIFPLGTGTLGKRNLAYAPFQYPDTQHCSIPILKHSIVPLVLALSMFCFPMSKYPNTKILPRPKLSLLLKTTFGSNKCSSYGLLAIISLWHFCEEKLLRYLHA